MKNTITTLCVVTTIIIWTATGMASCKKSNNNNNSTGTFYFHIHTDIDTNEVGDTTALYRDSSGRHFVLSVAQFYITSIKLHNVTGTYYTIPNAIVLKNIDSERYLIGQAPAGTYDGVTFTVGLDAMTNAKTPSSFTNNGYIPNSAMWFGTTTDGYMYLNLQGFADTTAAQTGNNLVHFSYQLGKFFAVGGGDRDLKTVTMPTRTGVYQPYILFAGSTSYIHLICDYGKLLNGVNFKTQDSIDTHAGLNNAASIIAGNIPNMFHYEE